MVKYPVSDKAASYGKRPHIKKGYYPGQLISVRPYKKNGEWVEGKFGRQLIFSFAICHPDESGAPIEPIMYKPKEDGEEEIVILSSFMYHSTKDLKTGEYRTGFTPKSRITNLMKDLGWKFSVDGGVDPEDYIGNWVEINVNDYEKGEGEELVVMSTIEGIGPYKGPGHKIGKLFKTEEEKNKKPEKVDEDSIEAKKKKLKDLKDEGLLTEEGYNSAIEQLEK